MVEVNGGNYNRTDGDMYLKDIYKNCDFAERLFISHGASYNSSHICFIDVETIEYAKELTRYVNYDCKFINGICKKNRSDDKFTYDQDDEESLKMCCCLSCAHSIGYTQHVVSNEMYTTLKKLYNEETGFWTDGGCSLPRKYRSTTCLIHSCSRQNEYERLLFDIIRSFDHETSRDFLKTHYEYIVKKPFRLNTNSFGFESVFSINVLFMEMLKCIEIELKKTYVEGDSTV